jgi:hypothetical protein
MVRQFARCHEDRVERDIAKAFASINSEPGLRRLNAALLTGFQRFNRVVDIVACLHLEKTNEERRLAAA